MCEGCATETVENGLCCECFDAIDAGGDVEAFVTALAVPDLGAPPRTEEELPPPPPPVAARRRSSLGEFLATAPTATGGRAPAPPPSPGEARRRKKRASTIEDRARRFDIPASSARVAAVDLAGVGRRVLSPADLRYKFACGEAVALDEVLRLLAAGRETMAAEPNVLRLAAPLARRRATPWPRASTTTTTTTATTRPGPGPAGAERPPTTGDDSSSGDEAFYGGGRAGDGALLFLGDYVDRGARGCEVLLYLLALKVAHPGLAHLGAGKALAISRSFPAQVHLLRGNHESRACTGHFGFRAECRRKYGLGAYHEFCRVFEAMPLAAVIDCDFGKVFACHGGIGPDLKSIADLEALDRRAEPPDEGLLCDVLWADPSRDDAGGAAVMEAGLSCDFGDVDVPFSTSGPKELVDAATDAARTKLGRVTTVFSASNYCGKHANLGAALLLGRAKATALLFEPSACAADVEAPDAASGDEAHFVRQAYLVVPYMPTSFRSLVDTAKELLGLKSFLRAGRKRGAARALSRRRWAPRRRAARGPKLEENRDPLAVSWADGAFLATVERGAPGVPRKTAIVDSSANGRKSLVTDSYRAGFTMSPEFRSSAGNARVAPAQRRGRWSPPPAAPLDDFSDAEIFALRLIFSLFDADNTGAISREELALYAEDVGECISPADVDAVSPWLRASGDGMNAFIRDALRNASSPGRPPTRDHLRARLYQATRGGPFHGDCHWLPQAYYVFDDAGRRTVDATFCLGNQALAVELSRYVGVALGEASERPLEGMISNGTRTRTTVRELIERRKCNGKCTLYRLLSDDVLAALNDFYAVDFETFGERHTIRHSDAGVAEWCFGESAAVEETAPAAEPD
ncbi:calcium-dependent protein serine/threonine phosphatase [Aureococcus anophagefferens]|nr:calcium-dependent protein serine/threonine phosphatase [Aureococcus anophagefferens]